MSLDSPSRAENASKYQFEEDDEDEEDDGEDVESGHRDDEGEDLDDPTVLPPPDEENEGVNSGSGGAASPASMAQLMTIVGDDDADQDEGESSGEEEEEGSSQGDEEDQELKQDDDDEQLSGFASSAVSRKIALNNNEQDRKAKLGSSPTSSTRLASSSHADKAPVRETASGVASHGGRMPYHSTAAALLEACHLGGYTEHLDKLGVDTIAKLERCDDVFLETSIGMKSAQRNKLRAALCRNADRVSSPATTTTAKMTAEEEGNRQVEEQYHSPLLVTVLEPSWIHRRIIRRRRIRGGVSSGGRRGGGGSEREEEDEEEEEEEEEEVVGWCWAYGASWGCACFGNQAKNKNRARNLNDGGGEEDGGEAGGKANGSCSWCSAVWLWSEFAVGVTAALSAVPLAIGFALLARMEAKDGLTGAWILMLLLAIFGSSPGVVYSNASGAVAVAVADLARQSGPEFVFVAFVVSGAITAVLGHLGVSRCLRLVPASALLGFFNSVAIAVAVAQFRAFLVLDDDDDDDSSSGGSSKDKSSASSSSSSVSFHHWLWVSVFHQVERIASVQGGGGDSNAAEDKWVSGRELQHMLLLAALTTGVMLASPRLCRALPPPLVGCAVALGVEWGVLRFWLDSKGTPTLGDVSELSTHRSGSSDDGVSLLGYRLREMAPSLLWWPRLTSNDDDDNSYGALPSLWEWNTWEAVLPTACTVTVVSLVESLNTVKSVAASSSPSPSSSARGWAVEFPPDLKLEAVALGLATAAAGCFGGQGGAAFLGQQQQQQQQSLGIGGGVGGSSCNVCGWGSSSRVSATVAAVGTFIFMNFGARLLNAIPTAGLVGIMLSTCVQHYISWQSLQMVVATLTPRPLIRWIKNPAHKVSTGDAVAILVVTLGGPLCGNLAVGLLAGCAVGVVAFAWGAADRLTVQVLTPSPRKRQTGGSSSSNGTKKDKDERGSSLAGRVGGKVKVYVVTGPVYFGSAEKLLACFDAPNDPKTIEVRLGGADVSDLSGVEALNQLAATYTALGKHVRLRRLNKTSAEVMIQGYGLLSAFAGGGGSRLRGGEEEEAMRSGSSGGVDPIASSGGSKCLGGACGGGGMTTAARRRQHHRRLLVAGLKLSGAIGTDAHGETFDERAHSSKLPSSS